jgi:Spy/CpxP family protein refolding chaperone
MKKLITGLFAVSTLVFSASAQVKRHPKDLIPNNQEQVNDKESRPGHGFGNKGEIMHKLNLTEQQRTQLKTINEQAKAKMQDLKKDGNISMNDFKARREAIMKDRKDQTMAILTPEQKTQLEALKSQKQEGNAAFQTKRMDKLKGELNLSQDQVGKLKAKNEEFKQRLDAIRNDNTLTPEQKKTKLQALREERKAYMESTLTPEQKKKFEEIKMKRKVDNGKEKEKEKIKKS